MQHGTGQWVKLLRTGAIKGRKGIDCNARWNRIKLKRENNKPFTREEVRAFIERRRRLAFAGTRPNVYYIYIYH